MILTGDELSAKGFSQSCLLETEPSEEYSRSLDLPRRQREPVHLTPVCFLRIDMEKPDCEYKTFESMLKEDGFLVYTNVGCSMLPLLRQRRDIIEIRPLTAHPKKYDVVLYKRGDRYILHRIIAVRPDGYVIAGDHNTFKEYDVTDDMILGVMTRVIRDGKSVYMTDWRYKVYYHLWVDFYPVRVFVLRGKAKARRIAHRVRLLCNYWLF